jgi:hypothetical protein
MRKVLKVKKIIMLGNSKKFFELASNLFKDSVIVVIPWRECSSFDISRLKFYPDLIIICGYDYMSGWYSYNKYLEINVYKPLSLVKKIMNSKTIIFYADTKNDNLLFTFSRYRYAKRLLGIFLNKLGKQFKYIYVNFHIYYLLDQIGNKKCIVIPTFTCTENQQNIYFFMKLYFWNYSAHLICV